MKKISLIKSGVALACVASALAFSPLAEAEQDNRANQDQFVVTFSSANRVVFFFPKDREDFLKIFVEACSKETTKCLNLPHFDKGDDFDKLHEVLYDAAANVKREED